MTKDTQSTSGRDSQNDTYGFTTKQLSRAFQITIGTVSNARLKACLPAPSELHSVTLRIGRKSLITLSVELFGYRYLPTGSRFFPLSLFQLACPRNLKLQTARDGLRAKEYQQCYG